VQTRNPDGRQCFFRFRGVGGQFDGFRHFQADFVFDDFQQGDVGGAEIGGFGLSGRLMAPAPGSWRLRREPG
jgi:hypothetical protein